MSLEISCSLRVDRPDLDQVGDMVESLLGFLRDQGIYDQKFTQEFRLAATEAINNAIEHGCRDAADPFVEVSLGLRDSGIRLKVADPSDFPGWTGDAELPDDPLSEGGRGRFLMQAMTDRMEHFRRTTGHLLVLHKSFAQPFWSYQPGRQEKVLECMTEEVAASFEMINALIGLGELLAGAGEMTAFLKLALERVCEVTGAGTAFVRLYHRGYLVLIDHAGTTRHPLPRSLDAGAGGVEAEVYRTGEEVTILAGSVLAPGDPLSDCLEEAFVAPIFFKNRRLGVLVLGRPEAGPFFTAGQLKVARVVGEYLGIVRTMNELQQQRESEQRALNQLEIAAEIQLSLMPQNFRISRHFDIFGACRPAQKAGGDYFDLIALPGGALFAVIADVMGKGLSAALFANMLRTSIRAQIEHGAEPGELLARVNRILAPDLTRLDMFITAACVWISADGRELREASAGHPPGLIFGGTVPRALAAGGIPIGVLPETTYETRSCALGGGEGVLLYTDGIPETTDGTGRFFEVEGISAVLEKAGGRSAGEIVETVLGQAEDFSRHAEPSDDRTLLVLVRT